MTIHASPNSVAGQVDGRPLNMIRSIASTPMTVIAKQLASYMPKAGSDARPERDALQFYMLEHASGIIRAKYGAHDVLPPGELKIMEEYNSASLKLAARAYYYLLLICWREMRHCHSKEITFPAAGTHAGVEPKLMETFLRRASDTTDYNGIGNEWAKGGSITLGQLTKALVYGYRKGKWGSAYGGPKWAVVTECLDSFVWGKTSAAMMLDTVWTLAHNTAPIFNKGMLFCDQDKTTLLEILDVQRAGMIPQYILTAPDRGYRGKQFVMPGTPSLRMQVMEFGKVLGDVFSDKADVHWPTVKALGGKGNYDSYISKLAQTAPDTADVLAMKHGLQAKQKLKQQPMQTVAWAPQIVKKIVPGVTVKIGRINDDVAKAA